MEHVSRQLAANGCNLSLATDRRMEMTSGRSPTRSLICNEEGIIIAETVFRCVHGSCAKLLTSIRSAQQHYYNSHMDDSDNEESKSPMMLEMAEQASPASSLSDSHPNVVKALTTVFHPCTSENEMPLDLRTVQPMQQENDMTIKQRKRKHPSFNRT